MGKHWSAVARKITAERARRRAAMKKKLLEYGKTGTGPLGSVDPKDVVRCDAVIHVPYSPFGVLHLLWYGNVFFLG